ncbi:MAG: phenylalanine--tRNA ligase subunit beta [Sediminibacterium sp.]|nr:phenylalanine--tRNA ligase subunit beta [Sediminibacterium sp.]
MKISYNWLHEYLPIKIDPKQLTLIFTHLGLEVEDIEDFKLYPGSFENVTIAEIIEIKQHPKNENLKMLTLTLGKNIFTSVICGAKNLKLLQKVAYAPPKSKLYDYYRNELYVESKLIEGKDSVGMILSGFELGVNDDFYGILEIDDNQAKIGACITSIYPQTNDIVYNVSLTANLSDCYSHFGVAKRVLSYLNYHHTKAVLKPLFNNKFELGKTKCPIKINIEDPQYCARYCGVLISNVTIKSSPEWLRAKLLAIGVKSINNIVDITNYILHETGQPLHAFDADKINGSDIYVKYFSHNFDFIGLDEKTYKLTPSDLMIADKMNPLCLAGIIGSFESSVTNETKNIFLESACFNSISIRKSSIQHGLKTEAAQRFEKKVDPTQSKVILQKTIELIVKLAGGTYCEIEEFYPPLKPLTQIRLKYSFFKKMTGLDISSAKLKDILTGLDFEIQVDKLDFVEVISPFSKQDVEYPADLIEEILRVVGFEEIRLNPAYKYQISKLYQPNSYEKLKEKISNLLISQGFFEIWTNSIISPKYIPSQNNGQVVKLLNSVNTDLTILRPNLYISALDVISHNLNRQESNIKIFEIGKIYIAQNDKFIEQEHFGMVMVGQNNQIHWKIKDEPYDFYHIKGLVETIAHLYKIPELNWHSDGNSKIFILSKSTIIGDITLIPSDILKQFQIKHQVYYASIYLNEFHNACNDSLKTIQIPRFPKIERDLSLVINQSCYYSKIQELLHLLQVRFLKSYYVFDIFEGSKLGENKKAIGIRFTFQNEETTLTDKEIDILMNQIANFLQQRLPAEIRI